MSNMTNDTNEGSARLMARVACALIQAAGMVAENQVRAHRGESPAYNEAAFLRLLENADIEETHYVPEDGPTYHDPEYSESELG